MEQTPHNIYFSLHVSFSPLLSNALGCIPVNPAGACLFRFWRRAEKSDVSLVGQSSVFT